MHHVQNKTAPFIFLTKYCIPSHAYPTNCLAHNFLVPTLKLINGFIVSIRGLLLWNNILTAAEKTPRKYSKIPNDYKGKTSFNDK